MRNHILETERREMDHRTCLVLYLISSDEGTSAASKSIARKGSTVDLLLLLQPLIDGPCYFHVVRLALDATACTMVCEEHLPVVSSR